MTTRMSPFKVVYGIEPPSLLDRTPWSIDSKPNVEATKRVQKIQELHKKIKGKIEQSNASYQAQPNKHRKQIIFNPSDWVHLRKERFPSKRKSKLMARADGPFEVLERINNNADKINLPGEYGVSASFNVADLSSYLEDDTLENLRAEILLNKGRMMGIKPLMIMSTSLLSNQVKKRIPKHKD